MNRPRQRRRKSSSLYRWILALTVALDAAMVWACTPALEGAWDRSPFFGVLVGLCLLFIAYFWLNGVKDIVYTACYHLVVRKQPYLPATWQQNGSPRVVMVYCTCDDFNASSLEMSMWQNYENYEVVILDDSRSPEFRDEIDRWAAEFRVRVIRRRGRHGFKAGNLNHGLGLLNWDYFVILDSDEVVPVNFIARCLDYFVADPQVGIVQANHRASRARNRFMARFSIGVDSHWQAYQSVKDRYGFMSLLGHGAMVSKACFVSAGNRFPRLVAEDICLSIEARSKGWITAFASDVVCDEEYPVDFLAFKKRHNKWTQGNMEFIKRYTGKIVHAKMPWYEKLDIILFTYSLPLTALFSLYVIINAIVFPLAHYTLHYPLWMLIPTVLFLIAPMANDILFHRSMPKRELAAYLGQSILLYGAMFYVSLRASVKSLFGGSTFLITPKGDTRLTLREALRASRGELIFGVVLSVVVIVLTGSILGIALLTVPAIFCVFMSVMHQARPNEVSLVDAPTERIGELLDELAL